MISVQNIRSGLISLVLGISSILLSSAVTGAERITFNVAPFGQFKIMVSDLEAFAVEGEISTELAYYLNRLPPNQLEKLPELLSTPLEFDPLTISKFSNSSIGEAVIKNFGKGIRVDVQGNGFYALRGAIIAAAFDDQGLTLINLLHRFPSETIHLDLKVLTQYLERRTKLADNREIIRQTWFKDNPERHKGSKNYQAELNQDQDHNQTLDVKYVLDRLEQEPNINTQQVGIVGQSFGGYTSLALAGGELVADVTATECQPENYQEVLLDLSSLAKCTFNQFHKSRLKLGDPRIKAAIAINPMAKIFGETGMSSIQVPTMMISGTNDLIMPPVAEQIRPFSWLDENLDKYLVLVKPGTHFSFLQEGLGILPVPDNVVGPSPSNAHPALKAISTAFFQVYLNQQTEYKTYLESDKSDDGNMLGFHQVSNDAFKFSVIRSLSKTRLEELFNQSRKAGAELNLNE